jgi:hypothetical protein
LTGPRTAEQSRVVTAALLSDVDAQRENDATNETRKVGKQSGDNGAVPIRAEIQCEGAFTYMNAVSRKNLTGALAVDANDVDTAGDTGRALDDGRDRARFRRRRATCIWGVSDPENRVRDRNRGVAEGVAHAPDGSVTAADSRADRHRRRRAPPAAPHRHTRAGQQRAGRGDTAPVSVFPPLFLSLKSEWRSQEGETKVCEGLGVWVPVCLPDSPNRTASGA